MPYHTILYCTTQHHITPHYTIPYTARNHHAVPSHNLTKPYRYHFTVPYHTIPYSTILHHTAPRSPLVRAPLGGVQQRRLKQAEHLPRHTNDQGMHHQSPRHSLRLRPTPLRRTSVPGVRRQVLRQAVDEVRQPIAEKSSGFGEAADWRRTCVRNEGALIY